MASAPASPFGFQHRVTASTSTPLGAIYVKRRTMCSVRKLSIRMTAVHDGRMRLHVRLQPQAYISRKIVTELTSHSPPPTPLLPALTLSAGEHQVSGGEFKLS